MADTTGAPHLPVNPLPAVPPRTEDSLVAVSITENEVRDALGETIEAWVGGIQWRPENVGGGGGAAPCAPGTFSPGGNLATQTANPFLIWEAERCTAAQDRDVAVAQARAVRLLEATTSKRLAAEMWRGDIAVANAWSNPFLARDAAAGSNAPVVAQIASGTAVNPIAALAALEAAIAKKGTGARGMIHATRRTVTSWAAWNLVDLVGGMLVTTLGTIVVPDAGYDGSAPGAGGTLHAAGTPDATGVTEWAYATGLVTTRVSTIDVSGVTRVGDFLDSINTPDAQTLSRDAGTYGPNDRIVIAQRYVLGTFDPAILVGVKIDLSLTIADTTHWSTTIP